MQGNGVGFMDLFACLSDGAYLLISVRIVRNWYFNETYSLEFLAL